MQASSSLQPADAYTLNAATTPLSRKRSGHKSREGASVRLLTGLTYDRETDRFIYQSWADDTSFAPVLDLEREISPLTDCRLATVLICLALGLAFGTLIQPGPGTIIGGLAGAAAGVLSVRAF